MHFTDHHPPSATTGGFTLIELIVTIAILAILVSLAVPSLQESFKRNEITSQNNELIALIHLARNEAMRRNPQGGETVTLQLIIGGTDQAQWSGRVLPPASAPVDDEDIDPDCPPDVDAIRCAERTKANLTVSVNVAEGGPAEDALLRFDNRGYLVAANGNPAIATLTLTHESCSNQNHARQIQVLRGGQVSSAPVACD